MLDAKPFLHHHLALNPADGLFDPFAIERRAVVLPDQGHQIDHQRIVVEHLLEVRLGQRSSTE